MQNLGLGDEEQKQRQLGAEVEGRTGGGGQKLKGRTGRSRRCKLERVASRSLGGSRWQRWVGGGSFPALRPGHGGRDNSLQARGVQPGSRSSRSLRWAWRPEGSGPARPHPCRLRSARFPAAGAAGPGKHSAKSPARSIPSGGGFLVPVVSTPGGGGGGRPVRLPQFLACVFLAAGRWGRGRLRSFF